jgi:hypothetical protein
MSALIVCWDQLFCKRADPSSAPTGWCCFYRLCAVANIPVYAEYRPKTPHKNKKLSCLESFLKGCGETFFQKSFPTKQLFFL